MTSSRESCLRGEGNVSPKLAADAAPGSDKPLVQAIELVKRLLFAIVRAHACGIHQVPEPEPLDHGGLQEAPSACRR